MEKIAGHCGKCGAPYFMESTYWSVIPPPPTPTCCCWNMPKITTSTDSNFKSLDDELSRMAFEILAEVYKPGSPQKKTKKRKVKK